MYSLHSESNGKMKDLDSTIWGVSYNEPFIKYPNFGGAGPPVATKCSSQKLKNEDKGEIGNNVITVLVLRSYVFYFLMYVGRWNNNSSYGTIIAPRFNRLITLL